MELLPVEESACYRAIEPESGKVNPSGTAALRWHRAADGCLGRAQGESEERAVLDLAAMMRTLAKKRPIFNSEADFQLALGWEIQLAYPASRIRMEYRPAYLDRRAYLDVWAADADWTAAIELKYFTRALGRSPSRSLAHITRRAQSG